MSDKMKKSKGKKKLLNLQSVCDDMQYEILDETSTTLEDKNVKLKLILPNEVNKNKSAGKSKAYKSKTPSASVSASRPCSLSVNELETAHCAQNSNFDNTESVQLNHIGKRSKFPNQRKNNTMLNKINEIEKMLNEYGITGVNLNELPPTKNITNLYDSLQYTTLFDKLLTYPGISTMGHLRRKKFNLVFSEEMSYILQSEKSLKKSNLPGTNNGKVHITRVATDFINCTNLLLLILIKDRILDKINYVIEETPGYILINATLDSQSILVKRGDQDKSCILKIFKSRRTTDVTSKYTARQIRKWEAESEEHILQRLQKYNINVPEFIALHEHIVIMALPGNNDINGRTLNKLKLSTAEWAMVYDGVLHIARVLFENAILLRGTLAVENILWYNNKCWLMNVVSADGLRQLPDILHVKEDCNAILEFFSMKDIPSRKSLDELLSYIAHELPCVQKNFYRGNVCISHQENCHEVQMYTQIRNMLEEEKENVIHGVFIPRLHHQIQSGVPHTEILDFVRNTNTILWQMLNTNVLKSLDKKLYDGPHYSILQAHLFNSKKSCIIKIFKVKEKKNYLKTYKHFLMSFALREKINIQTMKRYDINAPKLIKYYEHMVIMAFPGNNEIISTALIDLHLSQSECIIIYKEVTEMISKMYHSAKLVSGNLSAHNILWYMDKCYFLNASDFVSTSDYSALDRLRKDVKTITSFFQMMEVPGIKTSKNLYNYILTGK